MTHSGDQNRPASVAWTIVKFATCCMAGFAALGAITWLGVVIWLSTAAP